MNEPWQPLPKSWLLFRMPKGETMIYECANAYYLNTICAIGGIESHFYYMRKYCQYDLVIFYQNGDPEQLKKIGQNIKCIKLDFNKDRIRCTNLFVCLNTEAINITYAQEIYMVLHGDYLDMINRGQLRRNQLPLDVRITKYLGVSKHVCKAWHELTGIKAEFVGEPVMMNECEKPLMFISATRLSKEKGWGRMQQLAEAMDKAKINYLWMIFTNRPQETKSPNIIFCKPRLDITDKLESFDAYIQLSDNEGFCLSIVEALKKGLPVICTDLPVLKELGLNKSNSIKLNLEMDNIDTDAIRNIRALEFTYKEPKDRWDRYLTKKQTTYKPNEIVVRATDEWKKRNMICTDLNKVPNVNETWVVDQLRLDKLLDYQRRTGRKMIDVI